MNQFLGNFFESVMPLRVRRVAYMPDGSPSDNKYAGCEDCVEDFPAYKPEGMIPPVINSGDEKLAELKNRLKAAVEKEEFEQAAELRDEIKNLKRSRGRRIWIIYLDLHRARRSRSDMRPRPRSRWDTAMSAQSIFCSV